MSTDSRRAFPLDSRAVWVEQQISKQSIFPKDNLILGPGEYSPSIIERHISTPVLGKSKLYIDHFQPFESNLNANSPLKHSKNKSFSPNRKLKNNQDKRGLDPNLSFTDTPGSYLAQDSVFEKISIDGVDKLHSTSIFGPNDIPLDVRNPIKTSLPDYDIRYDSYHIKPKPKLGSFQKAKRIYIPSNKDKLSKREIEGDPEISNHRSSITQIIPQTGKSVFQMRCESVPLPKLKTRKPPKLVFNDSSYRINKKEKSIDLTPKLIKNKTKVDVFEKIVKIPREHQSKSFPSKYSTYSLKNQ